MNDPSTMVHRSTKIAAMRYDIFHNDAENIDATFSKKGKDKIISNVARRLSQENGFSEKDHYTAVCNTSQLFKTATLSPKGKDKFGAIEGIDWYSSFCIVNKKTAIAVFSVKVTNNAGNKIYTLQLVELKNPAGTLPEDEKTRLPATAGSSTEIIPQVEEKSNITFKEDYNLLNDPPKMVHRSTIGNNIQCDLVHHKENAGFQKFIDAFSKYPWFKKCELTKNYRGVLANAADGVF